MANARSRFAVSLGLVVLALIVCTGCSTPESRIEKDPALYASFPPDVQASVKQGKIDIGFTQNMVYVAWGKPDTKKDVIDEKGKREVWIYLGSRQVFDGYDMVEVPRVGSNGQLAGVYMEQRPRFRTTYYERASVTFTNGKVSKIVQ